jgi:hypothetical protein
MAVMSGAQFLNAATSSLMARYDVVCLHTIVGYAPASAAHFSTRWDGYVYQSRDTRYRSAANYQGNHRVISIENEDHGAAFGNWNTSDGRQVPGFTAAQVEAIAKICAWAHKTHGIPLVLCPDSKPGSRGIAYHRQGCDGNFAGYQYGGRVAGGELWSTATGKVCPGDRRINQLITQIIPRARQLAGLERAAEDPTVKNLVIAHAENNPEHWVGDGIRRRKISDPTELNDLLYVVGLMGGTTTVRVINNLKVLGEVDPAVVPVQIDYARFVDDVVARLTANLTAAGISLAPSEVADIAAAVVAEFKKEGN